MGAGPLATGFSFPCFARGMISSNRLIDSARVERTRGGVYMKPVGRHGQGTAGPEHLQVPLGVPSIFLWPRAGFVKKKLKNKNKQRCGAFLGRPEVAIF